MLPELGLGRKADELLHSRKRNKGESNRIRHTSKGKGGEESDVFGECGELRIAGAQIL